MSRPGISGAGTSKGNQIPGGLCLLGSNTRSLPAKQTAPSPAGVRAGGNHVGCALPTWERLIDINLINANHISSPRNTEPLPIATLTIPYKSNLPAYKH